MNNFQIKRNELKISDSVVVAFDYEISEVMYLSGIYIVLLNIPVGVDEIDNIYGVVSSGDIVWRVENPKKTFELDENTQGFEYYTKSVYKGINSDDKEILSGTTFFGMKYIIDHKTGKLLKKEYLHWCDCQVEVSHFR